jgi:DNA-binding transcriptional regulator LsrR (DeoR family)
VQISIAALDSPHFEIEKSIEEHYGLDEVIITQPSAGEKVSHEDLGAAGAAYLGRSLEGYESIAITWGTTLARLVDELRPSSYPGINVIQSLGGLSRPGAEISATDLTRRMAQTLGAKPILLSSPGVVENSSVRNSLIQNPQVSEVLAMAANADLAFVGLGTPTEDSILLQQHVLQPVDIDRLKDAGAVGEIALNFIDSSGKLISDEINDRVVGLHLDQIRNITRVIVVAGGKSKYQGIFAALQGNLISVLITDFETGERLLDSVGKN